MQAEIFAIGTELLMGELTDANSAWLAARLPALGIELRRVDAKLAASFGQENPYLGIYAKADGIHLRLIARAQDRATAQTLIQPVEAAIMDQLAPYVWGYDEETPAQAVGRGLVERGATLATMESGTGGYLANTLTDMADSEAYFTGGSWWRIRRWLSPMGSPQTSSTRTRW